MDKHYVIAAWLWKHLPPFLLVWGTIANVMSFIVFSSKSMRQSLTSFLFRILAVTDLSLLYSHTLAAVLFYIFGIHTFTINTVSCKCFVFWMTFSKTFSAWVLVLISIERFLSVFIPHKVKLIYTKLKARMTLCIIAGVGLLLHLPPIFSIKLQYVYDNQGNIIQRICTIGQFGSMGLQHYATSIWPWLDLSLYTIIPFVFLITINISIITKLTLNSLRRAKHGQGSTDSRMSSVTAMLLTVTFAFVVLTTPMGFNYIHVPKRSAATQYLIHTLAFICMYINHSSNFLFYCISGSKFRQVLRELFICSKESTPSA